MAKQGANLVRTWTFKNSKDDGAIALNSTQSTQYDESALHRLDLILAEASKNHVWVILSMVNYWPGIGTLATSSPQHRSQCRHEKAAAKLRFCDSIKQH